MLGEKGERGMDGLPGFKVRHILSPPCKYMRGCFSYMDTANPKAFVQLFVFVCILQGDKGDIGEQGAQGDMVDIHSLLTHQRSVNCHLTSHVITLCF